MSAHDWFPEPTDWLNVAAQLSRDHADKLAGQGGDPAVQQEAADGLIAAVFIAGAAATLAATYGLLRWLFGDLRLLP